MSKKIENFSYPWREIFDKDLIEPWLNIYKYIYISKTMFQTKFSPNANLRYYQGFVLFCVFVNLLIFKKWHFFPKNLYIYIYTNCNREKKIQKIPKFFGLKKQFCQKFQHLWYLYLQLFQSGCKATWSKPH